MRYNYKTEGVCAMEIAFDINDGVVTNVEFTGGCNGNLKAVSKLVDGLHAEDIYNKLSGNTCGLKSTSCADQLAKAVNKAYNLEKNKEF